MILEILTLFGLHTINRTIKTQFGKTDSNKYGVYLDGNGDYRLKQNCHRIVDTYNEYGEKVINNAKYNYTEINIDDIESKRRREEAIKQNKNVYLYWTDRGNTGQSHRFGNDDIIGNRYKNINNDKLYVIRKIYYSPYRNELNSFIKDYTGYYYMDMEYNICGPTEETATIDRQTYGESCKQVSEFIMDKANKQILSGIEMGFKPSVGHNNILYLDGALENRYKNASTSLKRKR